MIYVEHNFMRFLKTFIDIEFINLFQPGCTSQILCSEVQETFFGEYEKADMFLLIQLVFLSN